MIAGIGIDIIEIERIKRSIDRYGNQFLNKVFTDSEIEYCNSKHNRYQHFAARFAAKEAVYKAIASAFKIGLNWKDIEVKNDPTGIPQIKPAGKLENFLVNDKDLKISISHSDNYVTCVAIVFKNSK